MRDDLLRLGRMLRRALHEVLALRVAQGERCLRLEVEVLLPAELRDALEDARRLLQGGCRVSALDRAGDALEGAGVDGILHRDQRGERVVLDGDGGCSETCGLLRLAEHPDERVPVVHRLIGEQRLVVLDAGVVDSGHVVGCEHAHDTGHGVGGTHIDRDARVGVARLHGPCREDAHGAACEVVGVHRGAGDVERCALVRGARADDGVLRTVGECAHADTSLDSTLSL